MDSLPAYTACQSMSISVEILLPCNQDLKQHSQKLAGKKLKPLTFHFPSLFYPLSSHIDLKACFQKSMKKQYLQLVITNTSTAFIFDSGSNWTSLGITGYVLSPFDLPITQQMREKRSLKMVDTGGGSWNNKDSQRVTMKLYV